ncbi:hypothetical protein EDD85DRAFT_1021042 [Armillaria nabsnona]|nr:hypothetical protein EDD85DRAFT_1021042 [Armillaria nabsnona]
MGMTRPIMRNWAHLENVWATFYLEISTFELGARFSQPHPMHTSLSFSPGSTSTCQFRYMDLEREAVTNTELRGEYQLVASQIWRSAISRHILLIRLRRWSDITTLSLGSKKPHSYKSAISQPNTGGDYARMQSTVGTGHAHILPVAPRIPNPSIIIYCRTQRSRSKRQEVRFLPAHPQILQICATPFDEHRILDLTSGNGFTGIDPPPINASEDRIGVESRDRRCLFESRVSSSRRLFSWDDMPSVMEVWAPNGSSLR